ncbi:MAG: hypothetical protein LBJ00_15855 [Planctomycetaceae bacterium]|jgi:hypothetical protein|nr:hypothetical protein [Planctomycetaceae bacterium]
MLLVGCSGVFVVWCGGACFVWAMYIKVVPNFTKPNMSISATRYGYLIFSVMISALCYAHFFNVL